MTRSPAFRAWLALVTLTLLAWGLAENAAAARVAATAVILIALLKVHLVVIHFMELEWRPLPWRLVFEIWSFASAAILIGGYWLTP